MSWTDTAEGTLFNSTASTTKAPASYFSAPTTDSILNFVDSPFETWQSAILLVICLTALGTCAVFLAICYAQVLRFKQDNYMAAPFTLETQKAKVLANVEPDGSHPDDEIPVTPRSHDGDSPDLRRRLRAEYVYPKRVAIGGVREGKIAQRRSSRSRSVALDIQAQSTRLANTVQLPSGSLTSFVSESCQSAKTTSFLNNDTDG